MPNRKLFDSTTFNDTLQKWISPATGAGIVGFKQDDASAVLTTVENKLQESVNVKDFGAVGAPLGSTPPDETAKLTAFFNYLNSNPGVVGYMDHRVYGISSGLPTINTSGVKVRGTGQSFVHNVGSYVFSGTTIQWLGGATTGVMQRIEPTAGATNQVLSNIEYSGISFNCAGAITQGVVIRSVRSSLLGIGCANATTTGVTLGVLSPGDLGENESLQTNDIFLSLRQVDGAGLSGVPLRLQGSTSANVSLNRFRMVEIVHGNTSAVIEENADNNVWEEFRSYAVGSASYSVEWLGSSHALSMCRSEAFYKFTANKPAIGRATTYTYPSIDNIIHSVDFDNSTPTPVYEAGATGVWRDSRGYFGGSTGGVFSAQIATGEDVFSTGNARSRLVSSTSLHVANGSDDNVRLSNNAGNTWGLNLNSGGDFRINRVSGSGIANIGAGSPVTIPGNVGFQGTSPIAKPTVTGSRVSNPALASLLTALANYGLITNSTTA